MSKGENRTPFSGESNPMVSIITPSFNQGEFILDCLSSVAQQRYPHIEHIIFDAGSEDGTADILARWTMPEPKRFQFTVESDRGQAHALNKGFAVATGGILCWLNADDYFLHGDVVNEAVAHLARFGSDIVTAGGIMVDVQGRYLKPLPVEAAHLSLGEMNTFDPVLQPATFWRRHVHLSLREQYHYVFDWVLFREMLEAGASMLPVHTYWAAYREHEASKTTMDPATRKSEIASLYRELHGRWHLKTIWASVSFHMYALAETIRLEQLKGVTRFMTKVFTKLTRVRVQW